LQKIVIQKFGGTSVEDAAAMRRSIEIVRERGLTRRTRPLVVLSACAGVTNTLIRISELSLKENTGEALAAVDQLEVRHARIARELLEQDVHIDHVQHALRTIWEELRVLIRGVNLLRELTAKSRDQFQSIGERASSIIFHAALAEQLPDQKVHFYDSRDFFFTSSDFTSARPIVPEIRKRSKDIRRALEKGAVGVTQGFVGSNATGETTTIGRGGSDFSAAIMGVALEAREIQIWTDVAGIMTCDPRIVPSATSIERISFREASELAFFGAKVLHPETIWPAVEKGIPVLVLSSREPEKTGTVIVENVPTELPITGIAIKRDAVLVRVTSSSALPDPEVQQTVWDVLNQANTVPLALSLSANSAVYVLADRTLLPSLRSALDRSAELEVEAGMALITLVGEGLKSQSGIAARIFRSLGRANCEMISYGGSKSAVSFVVQEDAVSRVIKRLHAEFFE